MRESLLTVNEVRDRLQISRPTLWRLRKRGVLRAVLLGRLVRFNEAEIERLVQVHTEPTRQRGRHVR